MRQLLWGWLLLIMLGYANTSMAVLTNTPPEISGEPTRYINAGQAYHFQPTASDAEGNDLSFVIKNQPAWANFDSQTGTLSGTPTAADRNIYRGVRIGVSDGSKTSWINSFFINVRNNPPSISGGTPNNSVLAGQAYQFQASANDVDGDTLEFTISKKPTWASFDSTTGLLSGTPGAADRKGHYGIRIGVKDSQGAKAFLPTFSIRVNNNLPSISGTPDTQGKVGQAYSFTPTTADADNDTLRFIIKKRPAWAAFDKATGTLSGTPRASDEGKTFNNIQITAIDPKNGKAQLAAFSINIVNEQFDDPPTISGAPTTSLALGQPYHFTPIVHYRGAGTLSFSITNKPAWANFDTTTGTLSGTPSSDGTDRRIQIKVSDGTQSARLKAFNIHIKPAQVSYQEAHRFLQQASFGPTAANIKSVMNLGIEGWIEDQFKRKYSAYRTTNDAHKTHLERTIEITQMLEPNKDWFSGGVFNKLASSNTVAHAQMATWWENALGHPSNTQHGQDQLRQRVAYALSQILVAADGESPLASRGEALAFYYDILARNAFGNYRTLLDEVSRSPTMGLYLSHQGNRKADLDKKTRPDENFARELIQLFSVGLYKLNMDGTPVKVDGKLVPTYTQEDIAEMAKVMTGWDLTANDRYGQNHARAGDYTQFMEFTAAEHEDEAAEGGDGLVTIMGETMALNSGSDGSGLDDALDIVFNHPNTAPFISHQLIQRLVTSNPSPAYVEAVANVFSNNGDGERGDLQAVVTAILMHDEARNLANQQQANFGKAKEPLLAFTQFMRAFNVRPLDGWTARDDAKTQGIYWYKAPQVHFGQAAMRSPSVFNFYLPDYVPTDSYFDSNRLTAPELQIQNDQILVEINNKLISFLYQSEVNKIQNYNGKTLEEYAQGKGYWNGEFMLFDFDEELAIYEKAMDGDSNGDFQNIATIDPVTGEKHKARAVDALLEHLNQKLLGGTLPATQRAALKHYLVNGTRTSSSSPYKEAWHNVKDAVRFIATSNTYMVQK